MNHFDEEVDRLNAKIDDLRRVINRMFLALIGSLLTILALSWQISVVLSDRALHAAVKEAAATREIMGATLIDRRERYDDHIQNQAKVDERQDREIETLHNELDLLRGIK